ncbi:MAG: hypothetical protein HQ472_10805 [Ignavibacteria bacterium]|nr:hypothetical protein [Ignavibacteria bacterium]
MQNSNCRFYTIAALTAILAVCFSGCKGLGGTPEIAGCVKENQKALVIVWGTEDSTDAELFSVNTRGELFKTVRKTHMMNGKIMQHTDSAKVGVISHEQYCALVSSVQSVFLKTQALNSTGERWRYIDIVNPGTSVYLRAVWNPALSTFQSRDMRSQYDELMELIPKEALEE